MSSATASAHRSSVRQFLVHYAEMVLAMILGMALLGPPLGAIPGDGRGQMLLVMGISMTVPMVAWMHHRGHSRRANAEMAASMLVPTGLAIAVHGAGLIEDFDAVMVGEHVVMLLAMAGVMLARPSEYLHCHAAD
ncbi:MAG TPA: hypothetical protein VD931_04100 [Baekduia sp.]|nr:hypothetical protein [Baekduia sp.]